LTSTETKEMSNSTIRVEMMDCIAVLTFDRPKVLNAFDSLLVEETRTAMASLDKDDHVRAVVVRGEGRAFSAGFDMKAFATMPPLSPEDWRRTLEADFDFIMSFWDCSKPTVAAVHGYCMGGAFELALACDVTVAGEKTRFGVPEVRFGSGAVALLLPWITGPKQAKEIMLSGDDTIPAERALAIGIVNQIVPESEVFGRGMKLAQEMAAAAPEAVRLMKRAINRTYEIMGMRQALLAGLETEIFVETAGGPQRAEFNRIRREEGLKAALAWRDRPRA
jgi:enoyl-CoA hydratase